MDELDNGHKRPFGPHGEGCTCGPEDEVTEEEQEEEDLDDEAVSPEERQYARVMEISTQAQAVVLVEHFLAGLDAAAMDGYTLNRRQVIAMMTTMMTGYAEAKETAQQVEFHLRQEAYKARALRLLRQEEAAKRPVLHDVTDLFSVPSRDETQEEGPGSPDDQ